MASSTETFIHAALSIPGVTAPSGSDYDTWLRARVAASLADPAPAIPHEQVMAEMDALLAGA